MINKKRPRKSAPVVPSAKDEETSYLSSDEEFFNVNFNSQNNNNNNTNNDNSFESKIPDETNEDISPSKRPNSETELIEEPSDSNSKPTTNHIVKKPASRPNQYTGRTVVSNDIRYDNTGHWVTVDLKRRRCKLCQLKTDLRCSKCQVMLCVNKNRNCFYQFHH